MLRRILGVVLMLPLAAVVTFGLRYASGSWEVVGFVVVVFAAFFLFFRGLELMME